MPTDHPRISLTDVCVPADAMLGDPENGLAVAQHFVHENRIRQAASLAGRGAILHQRKREVRQGAQAVRQAARAANQAIQWPLVELHTEAAMIRALIHKTAWEMDQMSKPEVARETVRQGRDVQLPREPAGLRGGRSRDAGARRHRATRGTSRSSTSIRHHRRYRITEGSEEIQMRRVAQILFGFGSKAREAK